MDLVLLRGCPVVFLPLVADHRTLCLLAGGGVDALFLELAETVRWLCIPTIFAKLN